MKSLMRCLSLSLAVAGAFFALPSRADAPITESIADYLVIDLAEGAAANGVISYGGHMNGFRVAKTCP